jgi:LPXTG-motif cell wall-anchored protein
MASIHLRPIRCILAGVLLFVTLLPGQVMAVAPLPLYPQQGCTVFYASDGQTALAGNNEDMNDPLTLVWFIPAAPGRFGRVYFGFDDYIPEGGLNDQGVFFDGLSLPYKAMPATSQRPHFPGGGLALWDEVLSRSANVQDAIDIISRWNRLGGEYSQLFYGDRLGNSVIIDGDTILRKQGALQIATNFRLVENPNPPYPDNRYGKLFAMLSQADYYTVDLFRQVLDVAHAESGSPTLYSQVYELNKGIIHLYQFHDFQHEVVLNLADELAKGPHIATIASLFPKNSDFDLWAFQQLQQWQVNYEALINTSIKPDSQSWMSGEYVLQGEAEPVKVYLENNQLYLLKPNQLPVELYPTSPDTVVHHFFNGMDLTLTFQRDQSGQASGAQGTFSFKPYNISLPQNLVRTETGSSNTSPWIVFAGVGIVLILLGSILFVLRRRSRANKTRGGL